MKRICVYVICLLACCLALCAQAEDWDAEMPEEYAALLKKAHDVPICSASRVSCHTRARTMSLHQA